MNESIGENKSDVNEEVLQLSDGHYKTYLVVDKNLFHSLSSKKLKTSFQKLSQTLNTSITYETIENNTILEISGKSAEEVIETKMQLNKLLLSMRQELAFTHLITVPFNNEMFRQIFLQFKNNVLINFKDCKGVDEHLFQTPEKLHLTFGVLVLLNEEEIRRAQQILKTSWHQIVKPLLNEKPLCVNIKGLDVMNSNASKAHILYAKVDDPLSQFQSIADQIVEEFAESGFLKKEKERENGVKLHITFMNSLFRQRIVSKNLKKRVKREPFDASTIIDFYNNHKFSDFIIENIQLNDIKTKTEDGFYGLIEMIELPKE